MKVVQFIYDFHSSIVTKGNKFDAFSFFYHSGKVLGHVSGTTAPLHHQISIYYLFKENKRKLKKKWWCNSSASVVQYGAVLVHSKPSKDELHHDFFLKNQKVSRSGAVVQLEKYPIDCQNGRGLHHIGFLRGMILKIWDICRKSRFYLFIREGYVCLRVQSFFLWLQTFLSEKYLLRGSFFSMKMVIRLLSVFSFSWISVFNLCRGGKDKADNRPKKAKIQNCIK